MSVGSLGSGQAIVPEGRREEPGLGSSGGGVSSSRIIGTAMRQLDKVVTRTTAKLTALMESTDKLKAYNIECQKLLLIDDKTVEKQLLFHQIDQIQKDMKHREKLDLLPINFIGLVTKILTKNDLEYNSVDAKAATDTEITKWVKAGVWDEMPIAKHVAEKIEGDSAS